MKTQKKESKKNAIVNGEKTIDSNSNISIAEKLEDVQKLVHLLQIHQIELEHQNQELRIAQAELEVSRNKYVNLFDFAPIPYFTLNKDGIIKEVNLSASAMLGLERRKIIGKSFKSFILQSERERFNFFMDSVFDSTIKKSCELKLNLKDGNIFQVSLEGLEIIDNLEQNKICQIALIYLTEYEKIEKI
ncbi:MAG: PAS domain-containing protein [bacterium]